MRRTTLVVMLLATAGCGKTDAPRDDPKPAEKTPEEVKRKQWVDGVRKRNDEIERQWSPATLAAHPFWRKKLTADDVEAMVAKIRAEKSTSMVWIDDAGKVVVEAGVSDDPFYRTYVKEAGYRMARPKGLSERFVVFDLYKDYAARPERDQILVALKAKLDVEDYRR